MLHSWFGDFLIEEWIPGQAFINALSQKRSNGEAGDLAVGIWHDTPSNASVWSVYAGLSPPNVRPAFSGPTFSIDSRGIEPRVGPHRDNGGGLSVVGGAVVLGVYAGSYPRELGDWVCRNFGPRMAPFIELLPERPSLEDAIVSANGCPDLHFRSVKDGRRLDAVARFRTRMELRPLADGQIHEDAVYVSVAKTANNEPLPVRVSLLWLAHSPSDRLDRSTDYGAPVRFREDALNLPDQPLMGFVEIPEGAFLMGSDKSRDPQAKLDELPQHTVSLPSYYIGRYEVTVAQFRSFVHATRHKAHPDALKGPDQHPVEHVSWPDALAYATWLDGELRRPLPNTAQLMAILTSPARDCHVTLPSEAEWEKAARGTDARLYPWGDHIDASKANYSVGEETSAKPVGSYREGIGPYGLFDMSGNVWEWTRTPSAPGSSDAARYPYLPNDPEHEARSVESRARILRGGSYGNGPEMARAAARLGTDPEMYGRATGLRVAISCAGQ